MKDNNKNFAPNEQLQVIQEMIEKTKRDSVKNSWPMLMWGWLILISCFSVYAIYFAGFPKLSWLPWSVFMPLGGIAHFIMELKKHKTQRIVSYAEKSIGWIWIGCGSAMFIISFIAPASGIISWEAIAPLIILIIGIGSLATAQIIQWNFLFYCSLVWWVTAVATMFIDPFFHNLIFGSIVIFTYLVPGYIMRSKYNRA